MIHDSTSGSDFYRKLPAFAEGRRRELLAQLQPVHDLTDAYGELVCRAVVALGSTPPNSRHDSVARDLIADAFDFLYEWRRPLFEGRLHVAIPLARRAFESVSLLSVVHQDPSVAKRWDGGEQISNREVRGALATLPFAESKDTLQSAYNVFSRGTHPNRDLVSERFLGEGNGFVLGSIGQPEVVLVVDQCIQLIDLWFWFGALVGHLAREPLAACDPSFGSNYLTVAERAAESKKWLVSRYNTLLESRQAELRREGHGTLTNEGLSNS